MPNFGNDVMRRSIELAIQATGTQALDDVAAKIKYNSDVIQVLTEQYKQNVISGEEFRASVARLVTENDKLNAALDSVSASQLQMIVTARQFTNAQQGVVRETQFYTDLLEEAYEAETKLDAVQRQSVVTKQKLQEEADKTNRVMRNFSYTVLSAGHAFQDAAQGGFGAVLNNIPLLTQGFTNLAADMGNFTESTRSKIAVWAPAVAGSLTIVATAAYTLYQNWRTIDNYFNGGIPRPMIDSTAELERKLKTAKDRTEELGKLTTMTVSEVLEYRKSAEAVKNLNDQLQRQKELKDLLSGQSKDQRERGSAFKEAFAQSGSAVALDELRQALGQTEDAQGRVFNPVTNSMTSSQTAAEDLVRDAAKGDKGSIDAIRKALRDAFGDRSGFARNIQVFSPEGQAMAKQGQEHAKALEDMNDEIIKAEEQAADKRKNALISYWVQDEQKVATNLERSIEQAQRAADKAKADAEKEAAKALDLTLKAAGQQADANAKAGAVGSLKARFQQAGFAEEFAQHGANLAQQAIARGEPENVALQRVYRQLLKAAAQQEQAAGMLGEASQRLMMIEEQQQQIQARLNQIQGQMGRGRNRKQTLLPHPAQR